MSWCSDDPVDQAICLFAGLLANPDMPLSQAAALFSSICYSVVRYMGWVLV